ncbi:MAG TPA: methyltransferase type 11 [Cytophagales bacterium]|nr:methyltransferase type 11 [Cytophagales bacterium]
MVLKLIKALAVDQHMKAILLLLLIGLSLTGYAQDQWKNIYTESAWKERDQWQRAEEIFSKLNLKEGDKVADVGCHEGYITVKMAKVVGSKGKVYAVDVQQSRLDKLNGILKERNIQNVNTVKGDYDNPHLPLNALNAAVIIDTYHEMDDHDDMLMHIKASLITKGRLIICEPIASDRRNLTRTEQERKHELGMNYALEDLQKAGFRIIFKQDPYIDREKIKGDKMWLIVAEK